VRPVIGPGGVRGLLARAGGPWHADQSSTCFGAATSSSVGFLLCGSARWRRSAAREARAAVTWAVRHVSARGPKAGLAPAGGSRKRCSPARLASARQQATRWALSYAAGPRRRRAAAREARAAVARAVHQGGGPDRKRAWLAPAALGYGALSAPGFGAAVKSSAGFEARGLASMASSSGLCRRGRPWRGLCDSRAPKARKCHSRASGGPRLWPIRSPAPRTPSSRHEPPFKHLWGVSGAEEGGRKGLGVRQIR